MAKQRPAFSESVSTLISRVNVHFAQINRCGGFTDADKHRLKEVYLEHLVVPRAKEILKKYFPDDFKAAEPSTAPEPSTKPPNHTHQDRNPRSFIMARLKPRCPEATARRHGDLED